MASDARFETLLANTLQRYPNQDETDLMRRQPAVMHEDHLNLNHLKYLYRNKHTWYVADCDNWIAMARNHVQPNAAEKATERGARGTTWLDDDLRWEYFTAAELQNGVF